MAASMANFEPETMAKFKSRPVEVMAASMANFELETMAEFYSTILSLALAFHAISLRFLTLKKSTRNKMDHFPRQSFFFLFVKINSC